MCSVFDVLELASYFNFVAMMDTVDFVIGMY